VEATRNPAYLRQLADDVLAFKGAMEHLLELYSENTGLTGFAVGTMPAAILRNGSDPAEVRRRMAAAARAAGLISIAPRLTSMRYSVQGPEGAQVVDPVANWNAMFRPKPLLEPSDVLDACDQMWGRLEAMAREAEAEAPASTGPEAMHPLVWGAARKLWQDGHLKPAVAAAADAIASTVRSRTGRDDLLDTPMYTEVLSNRPPEPGKPRLRWPGDPAAKSVSTMNDGLRQFVPGAQMTVRNSAAHKQSDDITQQEALERLAALSLMARGLETCDLQEAPPLTEVPSAT